MLTCPQFISALAVRMPYVTYNIKDYYTYSDNRLMLFSAQVFSLLRPEDKLKSKLQH